MQIDFWGGGPLSYVLPIGILIAAIFALPALIRGKLFSPSLVAAVVLVGASLGLGFGASQHDRQAFIDAASRTYGLTLTGDQVKTLLVDHSYRRYAPDVMVSTTQGEARPYGSITVARGGKPQRITLYKAGERWYIGAPVSSTLRELPSSIPVVN